MRFWLLLDALVVLGLLVAVFVLLWTPDRTRSALKVKYLNQPSDYIEVAGAQLHVRDSGPRTAHALVMLYEFGPSLHACEPWEQAL